MGIIKAFTGAIEGTFADQWKEIITVENFDEHVIIAPGVQVKKNNGYGSNTKGSVGVISNGSRIYVPENTAAFIFDQSGIETIITESGGYEYQNGQESIFNGDGIGKSIVNQTIDRVGYGGITKDNKRISFVNLREIRNIKFGTHGPIIYNDIYYGVDFELFSYGTFSVIVTDPIKLIKNFIPPNVSFYTFDFPAVREQLLSDFLQSYITTLNSLSTQYRVSHLPSKLTEISSKIQEDKNNAGTWEERFGFKIVKASIESLELSDESKELIKKFSSNKMDVKAYEDISTKASDIAAQQKIASGIEEHGMGDGAGMIFGMNMAQNMNGFASTKKSLSFDEQIDALKKLKELLDAGILTQEEFEIKKKEIMGL